MPKLSKKIRQKTPETPEKNPKRQKRQAQPPQHVDVNQRYSINEGSAILRQSRAKTYLDIKRRQLRVIRDRARTYIPGSELIRRSTLPVE